ncbi:hypothetical protein QQP08_000106 [Theobroma cacao]|nr:hypothetical protein QQP08_000106 [Theobroma cacao]
MKLVKYKSSSSRGSLVVAGRDGSAGFFEGAEAPDLGLTRCYASYATFKLNTSKIRKSRLLTPEKKLGCEFIS